MNDIQLNEEVNSSSLGSSQKQHNQWWWWSEDIIPALVKPYMEYLELSQSLHVIVDAQVDSRSQCHNCVVHRLRVCCLFFHHMLSYCHSTSCLCLLGLGELEINYCACTPAPVQLMKCGPFGCSPVAPTLVVDLCMLEFMKTLFVWLTPNTTAWCEAFECFLDGQGYKLQSKVCVLLSLHYGFVLVCSIPSCF
ncbi:hypothetical protein EDD17DRAFT_1481358 [Pisolithus thermaeus]|nr:hypothetical protein EV401DRAFT_1879339 [Pisolithus croceorrhizus]KAI6161619.1 hypothetical protein EDD17DRAFT_1481358 [Pisolithus thermaeus]